MRLMAEKTRVIAEGAGALSVAAALTGKAGPGPIVAIVSGGNIDLKKFCGADRRPHSQLFFRSQKSPRAATSNATESRGSPWKRCKGVHNLSGSGDGVRSA